MQYASLAALCAALFLFLWIGLRAREPGADLDDYIAAPGSQGALAIGLSFLASGMGGWILFAPPEVAAFVGPVALAGYALGAALPFLVFGLFGAAIRRRMPMGRSLGEFAQARFGSGMRRWVSLLSMLYMLCFLTAELTAIGAITSLLSGLPGSVAVIGVAVATLVYTAWGGLRASMKTDQWQAWLVLALVLLIGAAAWRWSPPADFASTMPKVPVADGLSVALTLVIAVTAANLFHQGYWQRLWAARDPRALGTGALIGAGLSVVVVALVGAMGLLALATGTDPGNPPIPLFALVAKAPAWVAIATIVLAVALVASSVDTLQNGIASLIVTERRGLSLAAARWITVALMLPVIAIALQGISVLRLFLIADLLCATAVVPLLLGLWRRTSARAAVAGSVAGLAGAVLPGWIGTGSLAGGVLAASFPGSVPTLGPFAGALLASTVVSVAMSLRPRRGDAVPHARA
jgi:SSS family solute:Na+ symporter